MQNQSRNAIEGFWKCFSSNASKDGVEKWLRKNT